MQERAVAKVLNMVSNLVGQTHVCMHAWVYASHQCMQRPPLPHLQSWAVVWVRLHALPEGIDDTVQSGGQLILEHRV